MERSVAWRGSTAAWLRSARRTPACSRAHKAASAPRRSTRLPSSHSTRAIRCSCSTRAVEPASPTSSDPTAYFRFRCRRRHWCIASGACRWPRRSWATGLARPRGTRRIPTSWCSARARAWRCPARARWRWRRASARSRRSSAAGSCTPRRRGSSTAPMRTRSSASQRCAAFCPYLPSHHEALPPRAAGDPEAAARQEWLEQIVPVEPRRAYSMHKVLEVMFDRDSLFELKPLLDRSAITALARLDGAPVGVIASNPMHNGGALGADACDKMTSLIVLCDSFHLPLVLLSDTPGFLVGMKAEEMGVSGRHRHAVERARHGDGAEGLGGAPQGLWRRLFQPGCAGHGHGLQLRLANGGHGIRRTRGCGEHRARAAHRGERRSRRAARAARPTSCAARASPGERPAGIICTMSSGRATRAPH